MKTSKASAVNKALSLVGTAAIIICGMLCFVTQKSSGQTTAQIVTNQVPREVPTNIPPDYIVAMNLYQRITNATFISQNQVLFDIPAVRVICSLDGDVTNTVSDDEVRAKFELVLRHNNIPINPTSVHVLYLNVGGIWGDETHRTICFHSKCTVSEPVWIIRENGACHQAEVTVWDKGGIVEIVASRNANENVLREVEKRAEIFCNDFLSANSKIK